MRIATHNGIFHADEMFACAAMLYICPEAVIMRTRDSNVLPSCDVVLDVGGIYDPENDRFDHHQKGFELCRENGIKFSSFGLVWKKYGLEICGNQEVADRVDRSLVQVIDATDNGISLCKPTIEGVKSYSISAAIFSFNPTWLEQDADSDEEFNFALSFAQAILKREIESSRAFVAAKDRVVEAIEGDNPIMTLETFVPWQEHLLSLPEGNNVLFVVFQDKGGTYRVQAVPDKIGSFGKRKPLPAAWGGLRDSEMDKVTGVEGCIFCHAGLFIAGHKTKEGALQLAALACQE